MIGHKNINSLRNKFEMLKDCIKGNESFTIGQFQVEGSSTPYRRDRDKNTVGILLLC